MLPYENAREKSHSRICVGGGGEGSEMKRLGFWFIGFDEMILYFLFLIEDSRTI